MRPRIDVGALREFRASEHAVRLAFGGSMTVMAGLVAHASGPAVGGLFLAFPAILPASLTLIARHDGRATAAEEARGAVFGAVALVGFAAVARLLAPRCPPPVTLAAASVAWLAAAVLLWWLLDGSRR